MTTAHMLLDRCLELENENRRAVRELTLAEEAVTAAHDRANDLSERLFQHTCLLDELRFALGEEHAYDTFEQVTDLIVAKLAKKEKKDGTAKTRSRR